MQLTLFTCAASYAVDQRTNVVSVFNVVEHIHVPEFPCLLADLHLIAMMRRAPGEGAAQLELEVTLDTQVLLTEPFEMDFAEGSIARGFGCIGGMMMPRAGKLTFALKDGTLKGGKKSHRTWGEWSIDIIDATQGDARAQDDARPGLLN